jgi:hypothetical protein
MRLPAGEGLVNERERLRASDSAREFLAYCDSAPELRFWQALSNWSGHHFIFAGDRHESAVDTYNWKGKRS